MTISLYQSHIQRRLLPCTMMQRSKSAGKQPARPGYVPLPSQDPASGPGPSLSRKVSPGPDLQRRQMAAKRTLAPGQVYAGTCFSIPELRAWNLLDMHGLYELGVKCPAVCSPRLEPGQRRSLSRSLKSLKSSSCRLLSWKFPLPCSR